ncbi:glycosyltransferase, partial [Halobellus captivus]|uniref:glycosyltransferase n=1 Tax=Halobellus captivus TaxID=2592614 RepID=UPI00193AC93D
MSVGLVLPAFEPDTPKLESYIRSLRETVSPDCIRVELDVPGGEAISFPEYSDVTVNTVRERRGKGLAITQGFEALETEILGFADADASTPAASLEEIVTAVGNGADLAVGSRRHPESKIHTHQSILRRKLGDGFAAGSRLLLPVTLYDYQCGAKALTRETWQEIREYLYENGFAWDIELVTVADARGHSLVEIPVSWIDDPRSTVSTWDTVVNLGRTVLSLRRRYPGITNGTES